MKSSRTIIASVVVLAFILLFGILFIASQPRTEENQTAAFPTQPIQPTATPTPSEQVINGEILTISSTTVEYKNSLTATIEQNGSATMIYITEDTIITDSRGAELARSRLQEGMEIQAIVGNTEGGYEAVRIQVSESVSPTPAATTVPPTPTEQSQE